MSKKTLVKIRFNTKYSPTDPQSKEWRVIVSGLENFCNHITIHCPSHTSKDYIEDVGDKWHITCEAEQISYIPDETTLALPPNYFKEIIIN